MLLVLGCGYLGRMFLNARKEDKQSYIASTTSADKIQELKVFAGSVLQLNGNDLSYLESLIDSIDTILVAVAPGSAQSYEDVYLNTAQNLKKVLKKVKKPLYLLCVSSTFVYEGIKGIADEDSPFVSTRDKAKILYETEKIYLSCQTKDIKVCVLRLGGIYGPGRELERRVEKICGKVLPGSPMEPTNHSHVIDVVSAAWYCIDHTIEGLINVVNDSHPSKGELYRNLCNQMRLASVEFDETKRPDHGCGCIVSNKKIKNLGFMFSYLNLEDS
ncbi:MAG: NAD-dependent epimerase/dehydratase family protein [Chlamydiae bacterium]|nr:NAD-dependent epimerase/dehydratase family protein [Chlamydiota bacterium]